MSKILLGTWDDDGGATEVALALREGFSDLGHDVDLLFQSLEGKNRTPTNPRLETSTGKELRFSDMSGFLKQLRSGSANFSTKGYQAVHLHNTTLTKSELLEVRGATGAKLLYTVHSVIPHSLLNQPLPFYQRLKEDFESGNPTRVERAKRMLIDRSSYQKAVAESVDQIVVTTDFVGGQLKEYYPGTDGKVIKIPHGTDFSKYRADPNVLKAAGRLRQKLGTDPIILYVGRLSAEKGIFDLVKGYNLVRRSGRRAKLVFVGDGSDSVKNSLYQSLDPKFTRDFFIEGWKTKNEEIAAYYALANDNLNYGLLVIPSYYESFSLSTIESLVMGVPVLISDIDGPHELFVTHKPQLAYPTRPGDVARTVKCINKILDRRSDVSRRMRQKIQKEAESRFGMDRAIESHIMAYQLSPTKPRGSVPAGSLGSELKGSTANIDPTISRIMDSKIGGLYSLDATLNQWSGMLYFFSTPGYKHSGVVLKEAISSKAVQDKMDIEARVLLSVQRHMTSGMFRVPELIHYDNSRKILAQERIDGEDALKLMLDGTISLGEVLNDADRWTTAFRGKSHKANVKFKDTEVYKKFLNRLNLEEANRNSFPNLTASIRKLLASKWENFTFSSDSGLVTGDFSPLHLFYENSGNKIYGIDFNGAHKGSVVEEAGLFLGNLTYHLRENGFSPSKYHMDIDKFLKAGGFGGYSEALCPVIAMSYFAKGTAERKDPKRKKQFFNAALKLLKAQHFDVSLLKYR